MGIHESQSRIMEVQACHTIEFFRFLEKEMRDVFKRKDDPALAADNLYRLVNRVNPSFIRIEADEMTYPAHVILRYRIEKAVAEGAMDAASIPQEWNAGMQRLLGITPPDPSKGHMQDVHWPTGAIGYFPAYTIGDMTAAQLFAAARRARPAMVSVLAQGDFRPLNEWLNENVRGKAALLTPEELIRHATGEDLNADHYLNHLSERYLGKPWAKKAAA
jgi:carboxypeptidase Taq